MAFALPGEEGVDHIALRGARGAPPALCALAQEQARFGHDRVTPGWDEGCRANGDDVDVEVNQISELDLPDVALERRPVRSRRCAIWEMESGLLLVS
ncbi:hypothetical protein Q9L58_005619 [Maublancomyces gigas]|uniref:Uncharacterized protein n=1 Tax=Discina gigas TaxID=1032678 RepID=A0ABR3GIL5_9PEZI